MRLSVTNSSSSFSKWIMLMVLIYVSSLALLPWRIQAQAKTDPTEVAALNAIFDRWNLKPPPSSWNTTGDPCTGNAIDSTSFDGNINPLIKCDCGAENGTVCHITQLKVYDLSVTGQVPQELRSFPKLFNLNMSRNFLTGNLPSFLGNLTAMQYMTFGINILSGPIPKELGMLVNLISLGLDSNRFSGLLPAELGNLTNLQELSFDFNYLSGPIPKELGMLTNLISLWASGNDFGGRIPDFLGDLTNLTDLRLQGNSFQGPIPLSLGKLTNLQNLNMSRNVLTGNLPSFLGNLTAIQYMSFDFNDLTGPIPKELGMLTNLISLSFGSNNFNGPLPAEMGNLMNLQQLSFGINNLSGPIPKELGMLTKLTSLSFSSNNFNGPLPAEMGNLMNLEQLYINSAGVSGEIPSTFAKLLKLKIMWASDNDFGGRIPDFLGDLTNLTDLRLQGNSFQGPIPLSLGKLTNLQNLNMSQNVLTGNLPSFLGNLTAMQYMSFGINNLSGPIPKELGMLTKLTSLSFSSNNFNGPLPAEMGNLMNLEQLYINSAGVSGEIPSTFAKLLKLKIMWASDNDFGGRIPDFLGDLTNLTDLRLQGNSFQGPIPLSLGKLTNLPNLRIGDLTNGSSSLAFIQNMTNLRTLVLRNCKISDNIPPNIRSYSYLILLDLSFNNLTGQVPQSLFSLIRLKFLFLGNNSLSGNLPSRKTQNLLNIDLSYNNFSGSLPSWVPDSNLNLNLVANNFVSDKKFSLLPGLECLQKSIPCNRGFPIWSSFAINCGSPRSITSSGQIFYDADNANIFAASYYVSSTTRWGVSNVGRFADSPTDTYVVLNSAQFTNTLDSELFQTARISPSSLRYYGLGLENGNYTVKLQYFETEIQNSGWQSLGKRIFDIYIQTKLVEKDFNIRNAAGGTSFRAVEREYFTNVTENFLEIHFFWAGKGTCCIPTQGTYGPLISAISVTPNFIPPSSSKSKTGLIVGLVVGIAALFAILPIADLLWRQKKLKHKENCDDVLHGLTIKPDIFSYAELRTATEDFNPDNKLGEGGFGPVFKGTLPDGRLVAVKQLSVTSHQGKQQFVAEIAAISAVQHRNLVKLYGCCIEGDKRLLVYEYLENNSLEQSLFGKGNIILDWPSRFAICLGTARGLAYLHEESNPRIVHRDVKASNILLDGDLVPKISDFGLAKLYDVKKTHISTRIAGTVGYLAPEYALRGHLTEKADVFGFGVVVLEILTGRANTDPSLGPDKIYLLEWAWHLHENNIELELMDQTLWSYDEIEAIRVIRVALLCTQTSPMLRPPMSRVVNMLAGDIEVGEITSKPSYMAEWQFGEGSSKTFESNFTDLSAAAVNQTAMSFQEMADQRGFSPPPSASHPMLRALSEKAGDPLKLKHCSSVIRASI